MDSQEDNSVNLSAEQQDSQLSPVEKVIADEPPLIAGAMGPATSHAGTPIVEASKESPAIVLYDASAEQRIPFLTEYEGELYEIAYLIGALKDDAIKEYELRRNVRLTDSDPLESGQSGTVSENDAIAASAWLFDEIAKGVEGMDEEGDEVPENWKLFFTDKEKSTVIQSTVLACEVVEPPLVKSGKKLPWRRKTDGATILLRTLFNGLQLTTEHVLRDADANSITDYNSVVTRGVQVQGSKIGKGEIYIPTRMAKLGVIYDRLKVSTNGYVGDKIPLHHKASVVLSHLGKEQKAVTKNANGLPQQ